MLKKIFSRFFFPLPICLLILLAGLILLWFTKRQRSGKVLVTVGTILLLVLSYSIATESLLRGLERRYPSVYLATRGEPRLSTVGTPVKWIVVLGGGHTADPNIPPSSQLDRSTMVRLVEGVILYREHPGSKIIVSGGRVDASISDAELMSKVAKAIGVPQQDIVLEDESWDTEDEARLVKSLVGNDAFILVTSASHMLRSMKLFESYGMHPLAGPTDFLARDTETFSADSVFPEPNSLVKATRLVYEYLGLAWLKVRGVI